MFHPTITKPTIKLPSPPPHPLFLAPHLFLAKLFHPSHYSTAIFEKSHPPFMKEGGGGGFGLWLRLKVSLKNTPL